VKRGLNGLEGFDLYDICFFELMQNERGKYYRVYPVQGLPGYYETCGVIVFKRFFKRV